MKKTLGILVATAASLLLAGCGGGGSSGGGAGTAVPTDFNDFVRSTLQGAEDAEPTEVEDRDFVFNDDPAAFDDLLE